METMRYLHFNDNLKTILDRDDPNYDRLWVYSPSILQKHAARHFIGLKFHCEMVNPRDLSC
ncbi:hypothetical protein T03_3225 [Trichinella britovi]|uniref:PiggyBac transposable element-derived protein domain-containing protein n=1 Tax=Trichinella britovi TaxID=45882 RepID=A0A0V1C3V0_TRIBR|nr:hypothetical protein T03_3225 [Trichinella britovi]